MTCTHEVIQTWGDTDGPVMWACADPECNLRFYPACRECVDVGHRNIVHPARAPLDVDILAKALGLAEVGCWANPPTHGPEIDDSIHYADAISVAEYYDTLLDPRP